MLGSLQEHTEQNDAQPSGFGDPAVLQVGAGQKATLGTWG